MKATTIHKLLLTSILIFLTTSLASQCPFTASLTLTDAGGCAMGALGRVEYTVTANASGSIKETYYLVYQADGTTLVNSPTNTNSKVSLLPGIYVAKVIAHCNDGQQNEWTENFEIKKSVETAFTVKYSGEKSRGRSLNAINSGMLAFEIGGLGMPITAEVTKYPPQYTGPKTFVINHAEVFYLNDLAPGSYDVRFSNECVPPIIEINKIITATEQDLPVDGSVTVTLTTRNTVPGIDPNRPTTDYKKVYFSISSPAVPLPPTEYWSQVDGAAYYEYAYTHGAATPDGSTIWRDITASGGTKFFSDALIESDFTIAEMRASSSRMPTVYFRVKGDTSGSMIKIKTNFTNTTSSTSSSRFIGTPSLTNCNIVSMRVGLSNFAHATFPFEIQILGATTVGGTPSSTPIAKYTPSLEDLKQQNITFPDINVGSYKELRLQIVCTADTPNEILFGDKYTTTISDGYRIVSARETTLTIGCGSNLSQMYITNSSLGDFSGVKVKYISGPALPSNLLQEFTVPSDGTASGGSLSLSMDPNIMDPWSSMVSGSGLAFQNLATGTYTWEITAACGQTFQKSVAITAATKPTAVNFSFFKQPQQEASTSCNRVLYTMGGSFADLKKIFPDSNVNPDREGTSLVLCRKVTSSRGVETYQVLKPNIEVFYDGSQTNFSTTPANAIYTKPKMEIGVAGHFYLFAVPNSAGFTYSSNPINFPGCMTYKEIIIDVEDLGLFIDFDKSGAYFCSTDETKGNIFVSRTGITSIDGNEYTFTITNPSGTFSKVISTKEVSVAITGIDTDTYGTTFKVLIDPPVSCSTQGVDATFEMGRISNSATFISQNKDASCEGGGVLLEITAIPYSYTSFEWFNSTGTSLGTNNSITGVFKAGDVLTLKVQFNASVENGGIAEPCNPWTIEYVIKGNDENYYWAVQSFDNDWNNLNNWMIEDGSTPTILPGACASVYIPSMSTQFPDLKNTSPKAVTTNIYFEFGAQLYNQQELMYEHAFTQYDFAYYDALTQPAPGTLVQPDKTSNSKALDAGKPFADLPKLARARWYMLSAPLKGMVSADFQFGGKPFVNQRFYKNTEEDSNLLITNGFIVSPEQETTIESAYNGVAIWMAPYAEATGAKDQSIVQNLKGALWYPYVQNDEILAIRTDRTFNKSTNIMEVTSFDMETLVELSSAPKDITRSTKANRFVYEDNAGQMPAAGYSINIAADAKRTTGEVMIGNPFMAPLDFNKFLTENASVIDNVYKIISAKDGVEKEYIYNTSNPSATPDLSSSIAVQQAFIVKLKNPMAAATLKFPVAVMAEQSAATSSLIVW